MKLKRLDLHGFKSFSEPTSFSFQHGITCIVGPNGCGKSNIVDAIRWCMGEQSARHLRGDGMEDVIFNGSVQRRPLGMAEVSLTFDADPADTLPPQYAGFTELKVTRRLFRSGESEYFINKVPCRLKDITDLFLDTGVGTRAYSIIEQGQVEAIIGAKPEERRFIIEEAAGIRKYREKKREALRRMDVTHINLQRINDILVELERQIASLHRQAKKAERYKSLREEIKKIDVAMTWLRYRALSVESGQEEAEEKTLKAREASLTVEITGLDGDISGIRGSLREDEGEVMRTRDEIFRLQSSVQDTGKEIALLSAKEEGCARDVARLRSESESVASRREEAVREVGEKETALREIEDAAARMEKEIGEKDGLLKSVIGTQRSLEETVERGKAAIVDTLTALAQWNNSANFSGKALQEQAKKADFLRSRAAEVSGKIGSVSGEIVRVEERLSDHRKKKEALQAERLRSAALIEKDADGLTKKEGEIAALSLGIVRDEERLSSLKERGTHGRGDGIIEVLARNGKNGVLGYVGEIFEAEPQYRPALDAVLGERVGNVIVGSPSEGVQAVESLKQISGGRGTFIPAGVGAAEDASRQGPAGAENSGPVPLITYVRVREEFSGVARHLLRGIYLVRDLEEALTCWNSLGKANGVPCVFVTPEGDFIDQHGVVTGGSRIPAHLEWIQDAGEIAALEASLRDSSARVESLRRECDESARTLGSMRSRSGALEEEIREIESLCAQEQTSLAELRTTAEHVRREAETIGMEETAVAEDLERTRKEQALAGEKAGALEREKSAGEEALARARGELDRVGPEAEKLRASLEELRVAVSRENEKGWSLRREIEGLIKRSEPLNEFLRKSREECAEKENEGASCAVTRRGLEKERDTCLSGVKTAEEKLAMLDQSVREKNERLQGLEALLRDKRGELEDIQAKAGTRALRLQESKLTLSHLEEAIREKYQVHLSAVTEEILKDIPPEGEREEVLGELKRKLENMGEVNLLALDEYKETKERCDAMASQRDDLLRSADNLQSIIKKLNAGYREKFTETFHRVNGKFMEVFPRLFHGGRAELKIIGDDDLQECGIEIISQPPGKRLQSISLLSGGEKALTAVALIFSLFLIKSAPFCLLDEVDAPLDDINISRFIGMLVEMSRTSQFITITHNKKSMEVARILYGITMQEPGVSTLVSVKLN